MSPADRLCEGIRQLRGAPRPRFDEAGQEAPRGEQRAGVAAERGDR